MTELQRLLLAYDAHRAAGRACALATVVDVAGSAYRRPGARMLVTADGQLTGAISGGCLEGDARRRARQCLQRGQPAVVTYDSTDPDDDLQFGAALGCQGVVQILLEPLNFQDENNPLELLRAWWEGAEEPAVLATIFHLNGASTAPAQVGERLLLTTSGAVRGSLPAASALYEIVLADARQGPDRPAARHPRRVGRSRHSARKPGNPAAPGAPHHLRGRQRRAAGRAPGRGAWAGGCACSTAAPTWPRPARFPEAETVQVVPVEQVAQLVPDRSFALLMTHNYYYDLAALRHLLTAPTPYIGLLGPRKKYLRLLEDLTKTIPDAAACLQSRLHSPIGLNLGAETPRGNCPGRGSRNPSRAHRPPRQPSCATPPTPSTPASSPTGVWPAEAAVPAACEMSSEQFVIASSAKQSVLST